LGITHLSKGGQGQDPASRVIGSIAFTAVARCVLVAAKTVDSEGVSKRILMRAKANNGPDEGGFEYHLEQSEPLPGIFASYATWGQAIEGTAREVFAEPDGNQDDDDDQNDAVSMLKAELVSDCWTAAKIASAPLVESGFSKKQIWKARKTVGVVSKRDGFGGGNYWRLPGGTDMPLPAKSAENVSSIDSMPIDSTIGSTFLNTESMESMGKRESMVRHPECSESEDF
ncbi:MAG: AAA family ATPase, partial [Pseudomonadota bacterium]